MDIRDALRLAEEAKRIHDQAALEGRDLSPEESGRAAERRIWEGTDAFVNKCLGTSRELRSQGGRLVCWDYHSPAHQDIRGVGN